MEQIVESGKRQGLVLLVNLGEDDGVGGAGLEAGLLIGAVVVNLGGKVVGELGGVDEGHDVGVVLEDEDLLGGGLVVGAGADLDNAALGDVGELDLESKSVEGGTGAVLKLELVGVVIELEDVEDLGDDVEVRVLLGGLLKGGDGR